MAPTLVVEPAHRACAGRGCVSRPGGRHVSPESLGRHDSWEGVNAVVAGFGASGFAATDNLTHLGAQVTALDEVEDDRYADQAELMRVLGADVRVGPGSAVELPGDTDLLVVSPGWRGPLIEQARERGVPVWSEVELAWRLRQSPDPRDSPWLVVTGSAPYIASGMLASMLRAAGLRPVVCGAYGLPVVEALMEPEPYDAYVVALTADRLAYVSSMAAESAVVLDATDDPAAAALSFENVRVACVYNAEDEATEDMVREADVEEGARAIGFTLGVPAPSMVGLVDDILADRAFIEQRQTNAAELASLDDLAVKDPEFVAHALAAAALARAHGVPVTAVRDGLRAYRP